MNEIKATAKFLCLLVCLLILAGCDRSTKKRDKAFAEGAEAKAELAKVEADLEKTKSERDKLKESMAGFADVFEDAKSKLTNMMQIQEDLERQVVEITKQRDTAFVKLQDTEAMVTMLRSQLGEKTMEINKLAQWNSEWQALVQEIQSRIEQAGETAIEEPNEVPDEQLQEEVTNEIMFDDL